MLDLLLINPNDRELYGSLASISACEPPLWCALIASYIREKGYSVKILDAVVENLSPEETADRIAKDNPLLTAIIAMGQNPSVSSTPKMTVVGQVLKKLKEDAPHIKTLVGGLHPSALPERTLEEAGADYVIQGEGFAVLQNLIRELRLGFHHQRWIYRSSGPPWGTKLIDINVLPMSAWDLLPMEQYRAHNWHCLDRLDQRRPYAVIYTSLGCPYNCTYCPIHAMYGGKPNIRFRSPVKVIQEIDFLVKNHSIKNFKIIDELFTLRREHVERICDLLTERGYGLNIWAYGRVETADEDILRKMKQAGINWIAYGFESANETMRQGVSKKFSQQEMLRAIEMTRTAGINIIANVMFGLPDDSLETMQQTLEMVQEFNFEWFNAHVTMPYPGSRLYEEAVRQKASLPKKWDDWGQYSEGLMPLPTKYVSAEEVLRFRDRAFQQYFSRPEYLKMIGERFGPGAVEHVKEMLMHKIRRA